LQDLEQAPAAQASQIEGDPGEAGGFDGRHDGVGLLDRLGELTSRDLDARDLVMQADPERRKAHRLERTLGLPHAIEAVLGDGDAVGDARGQTRRARPVGVLESVLVGEPSHDGLAKRKLDERRADAVLDGGPVARAVAAEIVVVGAVDDGHARFGAVGEVADDLAVELGLAVVAAVGRVLDVAGLAQLIGVDGGPPDLASGAEGLDRLALIGGQAGAEAGDGHHPLAELFSGEVGKQAAVDAATQADADRPLLADPAPQAGFGGVDRVGGRTHAAKLGAWPPGGNAALAPLTNTGVLRPLQLSSASRCSAQKSGQMGGKAGWSRLWPESTGDTSMGHATTRALLAGALSLGLIGCPPPVAPPGFQECEAVPSSLRPQANPIEYISLSLEWGIDGEAFEVFAGRLFGEQAAAGDRHDRTELNPGLTLTVLEDERTADQLIATLAITPAQGFNDATEPRVITQVPVGFQVGGVWIDAVRAALARTDALRAEGETDFSPWNLDYKVRSAKGGALHLSVFIDEQGRTSLRLSTENPKTSLKAGEVNTPAQEGQPFETVSGTVWFTLGRDEFDFFSRRA
jgi:hypothetical protein